MVTGISYSTNLAEIRRLFEKYNKEDVNFKKLEIAQQIDNLKIPSGASPQDWEDHSVTSKVGSFPCNRSVGLGYFIENPSFWTIFESL